VGFGGQTSGRLDVAGRRLSSDRIDVCATKVKCSRLFFGTAAVRCVKCEVTEDAGDKGVFRWE
jgi:hypothetical protein